MLNRACITFFAAAAFAPAMAPAQAQPVATPIDCEPQVITAAATAPRASIERVELHRRAGVTTLVLASGLRVHVRPMPSKSVVARAIVSSVQWSEDETTRGISLLAGGSAALDLPSARVSVSPDGFSVAWSGSENDLGEFVASLGRGLQEPIVTQERFEQARLRAIAIAQATTTRGSGRMMRELATPQLLALMPDAERIAGYTYEQTRSWAITSFSQRPVDISIVGPVDLAKVTALVQEHLTMPGARSAAAPAKLEPPVPGREERALGGSENTSVIVLAPGPGAGDLASSRRATLLSRLLDARLAGALKDAGIETSRRSVTSLPARWGSASGTLVLQVRIGAQATKADAQAGQRASDLVARVLESFRNEGVSEAELATARETLAQQADQRASEGEYWASVLASSRASGVRIEQLAGAGESIRAITSEQVQAAAREWLAPEKLRTVVIKPETE